MATAPMRVNHHQGRHRLAALTGAMLAVVGALAAPALADPQRNRKPATPDWSRPVSAYPNLPGVKSQDEVNAQKLTSSYTCRTETVLMNGRGTRDFHFLGSGMPRTVYRCTSEDGVSYSGGSPPRTGAWLPGINPRIIDEDP